MRQFLSSDRLVFSKHLYMSNSSFLDGFASWMTEYGKSYKVANITGSTFSNNDLNAILNEFNLEIVSDTRPFYDSTTVSGYRAEWDRYQPSERGLWVVGMAFKSNLKSCRHAVEQLKHQSDLACESVISEPTLYETSMPKLVSEISRCVFETCNMNITTFTNDLVRLVTEYGEIHSHVKLSIDFICETDRCDGGENWYSVGCSSNIFHMPLPRIIISKLHTYTNGKYLLLVADPLLYFSYDAQIGRRDIINLGCDMSHRHMVSHNIETEGKDSCNCCYFCRRPKIQPEFDYRTRLVVVDPAYIVYRSNLMNHGFTPTDTRNGSFDVDWFPNVISFNDYSNLHDFALSLLK